MIDSSTTLNGVIGYPLGHSVGPAFHTTLYEHMGLSAVYLAFPCTDVPAMIAAIRVLPIHLVAVTIPHKETVMQYLDEIDDGAKKIGAVNTIVNRDGILTGYNTDQRGVAKALEDVALAGRRVLVLGAGGAARAVATAVFEKGAVLFYANRSAERARVLARDFPGDVLSAEDVHRSDFDVIINTTSVGMRPDTSATPLEDYPFRPSQTVFDVVYAPRMTRLLAEASAGGARTISGFDMFLFQALEQIRLWSGIAPPEEEARQVLNSFLPS